MNAPTQTAVDADSIAIAQLLGISTEAYLSKVDAYRASPSLDPELELDDDAPEPPGGVEALIDAAEAEDHVSSDGFEAPRVRVVTF
jgi:hypothetical protein